MRQFIKLVKRNVKLFFKDKGLFFTSLITPLILLVLYSTFLGNVFQNSYTSAIPAGINISDKIINGLVGGQLFASIIAVSCVTVAFCSNMLMVQDKISGVRKDFLIAPVKQHNLALSYFVATFINTLLVCLFACVLCFGYIAIVGWYFSFVDVLLILFDVVLLTLFGTLLASIVNSFLTSQGQISAVGTIVSSVYGFICGAYMPIATFGKGLQNVLMFLPSTYTTALIKNHTMNGALDELLSAGIPEEVLNGIRQANDLNLTFFGNSISIGLVYCIIVCTILLLLGIFILVNFRRQKQQSQKFTRAK
ncbi:MAG: ABC transporter permease [Clostridia bacterium]|nr:ABC transporter permease [Clostridia bacterium]